MSSSRRMSGVDLVVRDIPRLAHGSPGPPAVARDHGSDASGGLRNNDVPPDGGYASHGFNDFKTVRVAPWVYRGVDGSPQRRPARKTASFELFGGLKSKWRVRRPVSTIRFSA